jgi:hypothetical protein
VADGGKEAGLEAAGAFGRIARRRQFVVGALQPGQRAGQLLRTQAYLALQRDRRLEQRIGVGLLVHRALDALHQRCIDFLQLEDAPLEVLRRQSERMQVEQRIHGYGPVARARCPKAMPVSVWLRCMALNCSP